MSYIKRDILLFAPANKNLFVTEFSYSHSDSTIEVLPQMRNAYIMHIVTSGKIRFSGLDICEGEGLLICKNKIYNFSFEANSEHYWFGFSGHFAENILNTFHLSADHHMCFRVNNMHTLKEYLRMQLEQVKQSNCEKDALSTLLHCLPHLETNEDTLNLSYAAKAKEFIDSNLHYKISMEDVAKTIHLSEKHLYKLFKKRFGIPPQQYLINVRMNTAKKLLVSTPMLIKEVALNVGFPSPLAFSAAYKKHFGITPTEERNCP